MCGICGILDFDGHPVSESRLVAMRDVMLNRGPDYGGIHLDRFVGLGHRRLKIIDLSPKANQPMANEDGTVWIVFNGEIYNFHELRDQLLARGHQFRSQSDTEVIVHGYDEWGEGVFAKIDGMFAIGLWDARNEKLLLARDRFGKKPLYYLRRGTKVEFSSDIKSLWLADPRGLTISPEAIDCYLFHLGVPQSHCIFKEVSKVQPAHYCVFTRGDVRAVRYWQMDFSAKVERSERDTLDLIEQKLRQAVRKRLVSDVPLGAFLSGGVDSSLVVALMSDYTAGRVKTFSIGFEEEDYSELPYSRQIAERYGTEHQEIVLRPDVLEVLPSLVWEYGEPFADSSAIPTYYVAQAARRFVTVALTGDGGDEMFGGYSNSRAAYFAHFYDKLSPRMLRSALEDVVLNDPDFVERHPRLRKLKTMMVYAHPEAAVRFSFSMAFNQAQKQRLYGPAFRAELNGHRHTHPYEELREFWSSLNLVDQQLFFTIATRLPDDYLVKVDVASMKNSLELRSPFLDTELCELSCSIDPFLKVRCGRQKYLLKRVAERYMPAEAIYRAKQGFALPLDHWLRGEFAPLLRQWLIDGRVIKEGWLNADSVKRFVEEHTAGAADHTHRLWSLLWLELWFRMFIDRTLKPTDSLKA
ncbi:MAG: asparagine synthase (glutamine-hydrolyzing) [Verrucomicrobiota bacterium]